MGHKQRNLLVRSATAGVSLAAVLTLVWHPALRLGFAVFVSVLVGIALYEYYAILRARSIEAEWLSGIVAGVPIAFSGYFYCPILSGMLLYAGFFLVVCFYLMHPRRTVSGMAASVFGLLYVAWFSGHLMLLHAVPGVGAGLVTILFAAVFITDSAAYFCGSLCGRHKMAPCLSPKKSWEGAAAGFASAVTAMAVIWALSRANGWATFPTWSLGRYLVVGALLSIIGQAGDLAESCLKRDAGVKDSGILFPGHGGVLDRCDGLLFAAPAFYYLASPALWH
jgi:phosphatidate cytidylyltransferase